MASIETVEVANYFPADESIVEVLEEGKTNSYVFVAPEVVK